MSQEAAVKVNEQIYTVLAAYNEHFANWKICWIREGYARGSFEVWPLGTVKAHVKTVSNKPRPCRTNRHTDYSLYGMHFYDMCCTNKTKWKVKDTLDQTSVFLQSPQNQNTFLVVQTWIFWSWTDSTQREETGESPRKMNTNEAQVSSHFQSRMCSLLSHRWEGTFRMAVQLLGTELALN